MALLVKRVHTLLDTASSSSSSAGIGSMEGKSQVRVPQVYNRTIYELKAAAIVPFGVRNDEPREVEKEPSDLE